MKIQNSTKYNASIVRIAKDLPINNGRILVTGASGLIGSCVIDVLLKANELGSDFSVYALGRDERKIRERFEDKVSVVAQDISDSLSVEKVDFIIHAASNADPKSYASNPAETIITNVLGAKSVLDYCKKNKTRVLLTSTFEVYGRLNQDVYSEDEYGLVDYNQIRACYPESKRTAELLFRTYHEEFGVDCCIARLASIYGPTMSENDSKAHAQFIWNGLQKKNIVLKSEGSQKRTYCYLMDAVSGIFTVLFKGKSGESYNVANYNSIATIADVAKTVAEISGTQVVFDILEDREKQGFVPQSCILDTRKLQALGWNGVYDLKTGLRETIEILKEIGK